MTDVEDAPSSSPSRLGWLLVEPPRPERVRRRPDAHWFVVGTVCVGAFMGQLDASIVTLAFPALKQQFHAPISSVEWVALAYLLTLVALVPAVGRLADMVGRKLLYTYGFVFFSLASVACGLAPSLLALNGLRVAQAIGAAMLQANSVALIALAMPAGKLGRGIGVQGAAQAVGLALGPTVGGALVGIGGWRLIFFVNGPIGLIGTVAAWFLLPRTRHRAPRTRFDWIGLGLFAPAAAALLFALSRASHSGFGAPLPIAMLVLFVVAGALFVWRERRCANPMMDPALFRRVAFTSGISSGLLSYLVMFGVLFVTPFYLEDHVGLAPGAAGAVLTALPVALALSAPAAGRLADARGARLPTVSGMVLTAACLLVLALMHGSVPALAGALAVAGVGLGLFTPANNAAIMAAAPREQSGSAAGILNMTRGVGTSLGVAVIALVYTTAAGGASPSGAGVNRGFTAALLVLAAASVGAAAAAAIRER